MPGNKNRPDAWMPSYKNRPDAWMPGFGMTVSGQASGSMDACFWDAWMPDGILPADAWMPGAEIHRDTWILSRKNCLGRVGQCRAV